MFGVAPTVLVCSWKPTYSGREAMENPQPCGVNFERVPASGPPLLDELLALEEALVLDEVLALDAPAMPEDEEAEVDPAVPEVVVPPLPWQATT